MILGQLVLLRWARFNVHASVETSYLGLETLEMTSSLGLFVSESKKAEFQHCGCTHHICVENLADRLTEIFSQ